MRYFRSFRRSKERTRCYDIYVMTQLKNMYQNKKMVWGVYGYLTLYGTGARVAGYPAPVNMSTATCIKKHAQYSTKGTSTKAE